mmetsp:Transcript_14016/g.25530  ORF Transcript_14016/g.25530 Transcript_14016/m.25530 type:complete len:460 (-) Transcript_14016:186-1565(-)
MMFSRSALSIILAVTSTAPVTTALSLHRYNHNPTTHILCSSVISSKTTTALHLTDPNDLSAYGREKQTSELDSLVSKRDQIRAGRIANTKPDDDTAPIEEMTDEEIKAMFSKKSDKEGGEGGGLDIDDDDLFAMPDFKIKRSGSKRGLSSGESGDVPHLDDPNAVDEEEEANRSMFVDWTEDYGDENEFHIPNRIGFSTVDWGNAKAGFVAGKLKKKDRKAGKFNKADLMKVYEKLEQNGVSLVETSESSSVAEAILNKFMDECDHGKNQKSPLVASTFPNPWKHALKSCSLPRRGAKAIMTATKESCDRMEISSMRLYQVRNPWYYVGGNLALVHGMLDAIPNDHSWCVGCIDMNLGKLATWMCDMGWISELVLSVFWGRLSYGCRRRPFLRNVDSAEVAWRCAWRLVFTVFGARWFFSLAEVAFFEEPAEAAWRCRWWLVLAVFLTRIVQKCIPRTN